MNIFIAGASGLLGAHLSAYLMEKEYSVVRHGNKKPVDVFGDLSEKNEAFNLLNNIHPDIIVNTIALTDVELCEADPQKSYKINVKPIENIVDWIKTKRTECNLIHISTDQVYNKNLSKEEDIYLGNYYTYSKYLADKIASSVNSTILRTNFFGPRILDTRDCYLDWIVKQLNKGETIKTSRVFFSPVSIMTLNRCIEKVVTNFISGTFNVGSHQGMSKAYFISKVGKILGFDTTHLVEEVEAVNQDQLISTFRPEDMRMDVSKFEKVFNLQLPTLTDEIEKLREIYG